MEFGERYIDIHRYVAIIILLQICYGNEGKGSFNLKFRD